jgi:flagellar basal-body rod modification protein FlgD
MEITNSLTPTATANTAAAPPKKAAISSDFNTFLRMLTTQIKNQDPTNPMDSSDFAVQLATFSGVEQQVRTNDLLGNLGTQFGVMGMSQLGAWVGQEARASGPVWLGSEPVTVTYETAAGANRAVLAVRNDKGAVVGREDVSLGKGPHKWNGMDLQGAPLANGKYTLTLESYSGDKQLGSPSVVQAYSKILEARSGATGTILVLQGGIEVDATKVTALRMAGSTAVGSNTVANQNTNGQY